MAKNQGKIFEEDIKKSIPEWCWVYRLRDSSGAWNTGDDSKTRFTPSNICDFMVMAKDRLFLLELKTHDGMSIPISCIRKSQLEGMTKVDYPNISAWFILNFRGIYKTYAVKADDLKQYIDTTDRKSIPIKWVIENSIEIQGTQKRTRFRYYLENLLSF